MPLIVTENYESKHLDAVQFVARVPSRREAEASLARVLASLTFDAADLLDHDVNVLKSFVWSR